MDEPVRGLGDDSGALGMMPRAGDDVQEAGAVRRPSFLRRTSAAVAWSLFGFLAGAVFWHFVGFWSFLGSIVLKGPEQTARGERPTAAQTARSGRSLSGSDVGTRPALRTPSRPASADGESCAELAINRAMGTTSRRACPKYWTSGALVEMANGKEDREAVETAPVLAVDGWSTTIDTGSIKR